MAKNVIKEGDNLQLHVITCELSDKYPSRVNVIVEEELFQLGEKGEEKTQKQFSIENYALHVTLREKCKRYLKMTFFSGGRRLDAGEIGAILGGATVTVARSLAKEGTPRKKINGKDTGTYERDTYITDILDVKFEDDPMMTDAEIKSIIRENNTLNKMEQANAFAF